MSLALRGFHNLMVLSDEQLIKYYPVAWVISGHTRESSSIDSSIVGF